MEFGKTRGRVTPQELNPSSGPKPKRVPKMVGRRKKEKVKRKKNKAYIEELKKEVVMVRTPKMDANKLPSENTPQPSTF